MNLLAAEITARTGRDPGERYAALTAELGKAYYARIDAPATPAQKAKRARLSPESVKAFERGRRTDHPETDARSGKQGSNRRPEGRHRQRLVRGAPVRHGSRVQDLCREASATSGICRCS